MDFSDKYLSMCEMAYPFLGVPPNINKKNIVPGMPNLWRMPNPGTDRWVGKHRTAIGNIGEVTDGAFIIYSQEQLQGMVVLKGYRFHIITCNQGFKFIYKYGQSQKSKISLRGVGSMEQGWLSFVMMELHKARWTRSGKWMSV
jgi:hypothetical protein